MSILWIGFLTAIIGDVASHLGCSVGLKDSVTALSLVAMGTSLPGLSCRLSRRPTLAASQYHHRGANDMGFLAAMRYHAAVVCARIG